MTTHIVQVLEAITQLKTTLILLQTLICGLVCFLQRAIRTIPVQVSVRASVMFEDAHGDIYHIDALFIDSWRVSERQLMLNTREHWLTHDTGVSYSAD